MKRQLIGLAVGIAMCGAFSAAAEERNVAVGLSVPQQCYAQPNGQITGSATLDPTTLQPTAITFTETTVTVNCNVAGSVLTLTHTDPTTPPELRTNNPQFTNTIRIGVWLGGDGTFGGKRGKREEDENTSTWATGLQVPGNGRPSSYAYGRYRFAQPVYVTRWEVDAGKALVAGGYQGTITVTMQPDRP